jgi:hypothetical protein
MGRGLGVPRRDIAAGSHGLSREYGCCDQRGRHKGHFGHLFLHMVIGAKEALGPLWRRVVSLGNYFITHFQ